MAQQYAEIRLKKGMVLKGELLRVVIDKEVVLKTTWRDSILLAWSDIAYIDFAAETSAHTESQKRIKPHYAFSDSTWFGTFETRFGGSQGDWGAVINPGFMLSAGRYINKNRYLGIAATAGYDYMYNLGSDLIPVGLNIRGHFRKGGLTGFYDLGVGYSIANENGSNRQVIKKNGGAYVYPSIGLISKKRPNVATYMKLGYNYTSYGEKYNDVIWQQWGGWTNVEVRRQYDLQSIRLSFGLYFD
jgi:hypothetical protein